MLSEQKRAAILNELRRDYCQSNHTIAENVHSSPITVACVRLNAEMEGQIAVRERRIMKTNGNHVLNKAALTEDRKKQVHDELVRDPHRADRVIARELKIHPMSVHRAREQAEKQGLIPHVPIGQRKRGVLVDRSATKMKMAERVKVIETELIADPSQSNRAIALKAGSHAESVGRRRHDLEKAGVIEVVAKRTPSITPEAKAARSANLAALRTQRIEAVKGLLAASHNTDHIAREVGISEQHLREFMRRNGIEMPGWMHKKRRAVESSRVIEQTVNALQGAAHGLQLIRDQPVDMEPAHAAELLDEFNAAMKAIKWMANALEERANG